MRGKRSKQYRKLMHQYELTFNFRTPYQVLVDAQMIQDALRFHMDLPKGMHSTLHGEIKPMITQCSIRHLYNLSASVTDKNTTTEQPPVTQAQKTACIELSKTFERRRCNHEEPLSTLECLKAVLDPKDSGTNKHRYVLAVQDPLTRQWARGVKGLPTIYVARSVMIMEPMAEASIRVKDGEERGKLRSGIRRSMLTAGDGEKRKREELKELEVGQDKVITEEEQVHKKRKIKGPKGPNPLSIKKTKMKMVDQNEDAAATSTFAVGRNQSGHAQDIDRRRSETPSAKRKRKHKATVLKTGGDGSLPLVRGAGDSSGD